MRLDGRYISLNRQFSELGDVGNIEDLAFRSYVGQTMGLARDIDWEDICRAGQSCVILGEAGSGKSREMQEQTKELLSAGQPAVFLDLTDLLSGVTQLDGDQVLRTWRRSDAIAWFFLDSVDESKLGNVNDFHRALKRLAQWLDVDSHRARFVISSRISEWRPARDKQLVEETLLRLASDHHQGRLSLPQRSFRSGANATGEALSPDKQAAATGLRVLILLPLTEQQARSFLSANGPVDERFFADVEDADAWDFLRRPLDVSNVYALWQSQGRLGTLREVIEHSITRLLQDPQRPSRLAADRLRKGVEHLAASLSFAKRVSTLVPDAVLSDASDALPLHTGLPRTWSDADAGLLAQCPLFDTETYGKIRFHHRLYQDYLSAWWLVRLMRSDCPYAELRHLLFAEVSGGQLILRPSLVAAAAWLACMNEGDAHWQVLLRGDLLHNSPWVFFAHGDPRALPLEYRAKLLRRTAEYFKDRDRVQVDWDRPTLKRFSDPELTEEVACVIADVSVPVDLRNDYLTLANCGRLTGALPSVLALAFDEGANDELRVTALICISEIGLPAHRRQALTAFEACDSFRPRLGLQLAQLAYLQEMDECKLFWWLGRVGGIGEETASYALFRLGEVIEQNIPADRVLPFLRQLCLFLLDERGQPREDRAWAGEWLAPFCVRALKAPKLEVQALEILLDACALFEMLRERRLLDITGYDDASTTDLTDATTKHPAFRREWYWRKVAQYRAIEGKEPYAIWVLPEHDAALTHDRFDLEWLVQDIRNADHPADRLFALRSALSLCNRGARRFAPLPPPSILQAAIGVPALYGELLKLVWIQLTGPWYRLRQQWDWNWRRRSWWGRKLKPMRDAYWNRRNRLHLWWRRAALRQGSWFDGVWFVIERARVRRGAGQWGSHDLTLPTARYGPAVVGAAMQGADKLWRQHCPDLPHENPRRNETLNETVLGLVALQFAWQSQGEVYFQSLTEEDAEKATRYALNELNGLPAWFSALTLVHPLAVSRIVSLALQGEWQTTPADEQFGSRTLRRLVHASEKRLSDFAVPALFDLLMGPPPANTGVLRDALHLILNAKHTERGALAARAAMQLDGVSEVGASDWPWLTSLFLTDASQAFGIVDRIFLTLDAEQRDALAVSLCANLCDEFHGGLSCAVPDFERPAFLRRFIPWVYGHVRPDDDPVHEGVYSPGPRDNAVSFRGGLFGRLEAYDGDEVETVLAELAADPKMASIRDFVLRRLDQRKAYRADRYTVEPGDLEQLLSRHERAPRSRADLFHLAIARLSQFKEQVESNEISIRAECGVHWHESDYQDWIQRHLMVTAYGLYTLPSEAKVDPGKFPDLRFETPGVDGAVSVEVKVATFAHWSYAKLEERLKNQLVGQYLRAKNARHGVYLLFRSEASRQWTDHDGGVLAWPELLARLQAVADAILAERPDVEKLRVFGVDVTLPALPSGR